MADKISGAGGSTTGVMTDTDATSAPAEGAGKNNVQEALDDVGGCLSETAKDVWQKGPAAHEDFEAFVGEHSKDGDVEEAVFEAGKKTLFEFMAENSRAKARAEKAAIDEVSGGDEQLADFHETLSSNSGKLAKMDQNDMRGMLNDAFGKNAWEEKLDFAAQLRPGARADFADNISRTLMRSGDVPEEQVAEIRDRILAATEDVVLNAFEDKFIEGTVTTLENAKLSIQNRFNADPSARREVLASFAEKSSDSTQIAQMMVATLGVPEDDARAIAGELAELHGHPDKIAALRGGAEGPGASIVTDGAYTDLEQALEDALDDAADNMQGLVRRLRSDRFRGNSNDDHRVLVDDTFKLGRQMFMHKLSSGPARLGDDALEGLRTVMEQEKAEAESNLFEEDIAKSSILIAAGIGVTLATGGAAAGGLVGFATSNAGAAPGMVNAWQDVELAEQAQAHGQTDKNTVEAAKHARNKAIALHIASSRAPSMTLRGQSVVGDAVRWGSNVAIGEAYNFVLGEAYDAASTMLD